MKLTFTQHAPFLTAPWNRPSLAVRLYFCNVVMRNFKYPKRNNGPGAFPRPLPVICWDWTKAIAPEAIARARRLILPLGLTWGLGRDALGLSHLT